MLVIPRKKKRRMRSPTENMKTAYGLEVVEGSQSKGPGRFITRNREAEKSELPGR
jgi:hypothetical protein